MTTGLAVWAVTQHVNWVGLAGHKIPNGALVLSCSRRNKSDLWNQGVRHLRTWTVKAKLEHCRNRSALREMVLLHSEC